MGARVTGRRRIVREYGLGPRSLGVGVAVLRAANAMTVHRLLSTAAEAVRVTTAPLPRAERLHVERRALGGIMAAATSAGWPKEYTGPIIYGDRWRPP